jgi:Protein of unknown function (DUF4038)
VAPPYIAGISANGRYWIDDSGNPRLFACENVWNLPGAAGQWNSGDYQSTYDSYLNQRAGQGYTATHVSFCSVDDPGNTFNYVDGRDWDGVYPFASTLNPSTGFNEPFWVRRDYMINSARAQGMTIVMNITTPGAGKAGTVNENWTNQNWTDFGTSLGNRYKTGFPNLLWIVGDDYYGNLDAQFTLMMNAVKATGDTHLWTIMNMQETTSRYGFNPDHTPDICSFDVNAQYDWVYTYNPSYNGVTYAQQYEPSGTDVVQGPIPVMWCDGFYLNSSVGPGQTDQKLERQNLWWALSSGACGFSTGDNNVYVWGSDSAGFMAGTFYASVIPAITSAFSNLPNWQNLISDWNSALVTSGRGTRAADVATGSNGYINNTDNWVTASRTPDGTLAVIYCAQAFNITINQALLTPGYGAYRIDPLTGTKTQITAGASYNSSAWGNNSAGDPDWVLALAAPPYATWTVP